MEVITDLIDNDKVIQQMDEEVAEEIHDVNSKILIEMSKKIIQSIYHMNRVEQLLDKEHTENTENKDKLIEKLEELKHKQNEISEELKRIESELKGEKGTGNEVSNIKNKVKNETDKTQDTQFHKESVPIEKMATTEAVHRKENLSNKELVHVGKEKENVQHPNVKLPNVPEDINPTVKNIKEVAPKENTKPDKRMQRIEEDRKKYCKQGNIDFDQVQTYASVNKPYRPEVDSSESSVLHVYGKAGIGNR